MTIKKHPPRFRKLKSSSKKYPGVIGVSTTDFHSSREDVGEEQFTKEVGNYLKQLAADTNIFGNIERYEDTAKDILKQHGINTDFENTAQGVWKLRKRLDDKAPSIEWRAAKIIEIAFDLKSHIDNKDIKGAVLNAFRLQEHVTLLSLSSIELPTAIGKEQQNQWKHRKKWTQEQKQEWTRLFNQYKNSGNSYLKPNQKPHKTKISKKIAEETGAPQGAIYEHLKQFK